MLRMHLMVGDLVLLDRAEGAQPHMQGDERRFHSHRPHLLQQLRGEMQPGGGGGGATQLPGIHRLIPLLVPELFVDIGG